MVSVIGVYGGFIDKFPMGAVMNRSLTIRSGQCHVQRYLRPLLERIQTRGDRPQLRHHPPPAAGRGGPRATTCSCTSGTNCEKVVLSAN